eukprot:COSAG01_NODE_1531_length_10004_cov_5.769006_5_plen_68_part_00
MYPCSIALLLSAVLCRRDLVLTRSSSTTRQFTVLTKAMAALPVSGSDRVHFLGACQLCKQPMGARIP